MDPLRLAYSPCPNDTYIFHAWAHGLVRGAPPVEERLEDVDKLNGLALAGEADVIKVSIHAFAHLRGTYALLHSGGALGRGCGPLVVARKDSWLRPAPSIGRVATLADHLGRIRVAIPGELTTGALLLGLFAGSAVERLVMPFDRIMPAVVSGEADAGVIIHEGRFTYGSYGLRRLIDLGEWWEDTVGLPLPLGAIAVARSLSGDLTAAVERAVRESVEHAFAHPTAALDYVREHAQEMDDAVCAAHIELYVNEFTRDYGTEGEAAIRRMLDTAAALGVAPDSGEGLFWDE
ncbi:MAG: 1,4-dihydroxy-6-naphthoate synthase [bacterium]